MTYTQLCVSFKGRVNRSLFCIGAILTCVVGCAKPTTEIMDSWTGSHISELIKSWGPPQQIVSDGANGSIYIYSNTSHTITTRPLRIIPQSKPFAIKTTSRTHSRTRMFWTDKYGIIYHWRAEGDIKKKGDPSDGAVLIATLTALSIGFVIAIIGAAGGFQ